jgi:translation initiation factor 1
MSGNNKESRLVYSTDPELNRRCPRCKELVPECTCNNTVVDGSKKLSAVLRIEKAGRGGKTVTVIDQLPKSEAFLKEWTTKLKKRCGSGGTYHMDRMDGVIEIQGDRREAIRELLSKEGIRVRG